jgi:hypothetical protein
MSSKTSAYASIAGIAAVTLIAMASYMYYANSSEEIGPTGMNNYPISQYGGKQTRRRHRHGRKTRRN